jgi:hypothetical protein
MNKYCREHGRKINRTLFLSSTCYPKAPGSPDRKKFKPLPHGMHQGTLKSSGITGDRACVAQDGPLRDILQIMPLAAQDACQN